MGEGGEWAKGANARRPARHRTGPGPAPRADRNEGATPGSADRLVRENRARGIRPAGYSVGSRYRFEIPRHCEARVLDALEPGALRLNPADPRGYADG